MLHFTFSGNSVRHATKKGADPAENQSGFKRGRETSTQQKTTSERETETEFVVEASDIRGK